MRCLQVVPTRLPQHRRTHISNDLATCTHVFVRNDAVRKPLQPPYNGPFLVLKRSPKHYTIDYNGQPTTVSLDRIKLAHLDSTLTQDRELTFLQPHPLHHSPVGLHAQAATYTGQTISSTPCSALGGEWCSRLIRTLYSTRGHIQNIRCT